MLVDLPQRVAESGAGAVKLSVPGRPTNLRGQVPAVLAASAGWSSNLTYAIFCSHSL